MSHVWTLHVFRGSRLSYLWDAKHDSFPSPAPCPKPVTEISVPVLTCSVRLLKELLSLALEGRRQVSPQSFKLISGLDPCCSPPCPTGNFRVSGSPLFKQWRQWQSVPGSTPDMFFFFFFGIAFPCVPAQFAKETRFIHALCLGFTGTFNSKLS